MKVSAPEGGTNLPSRVFNRSIELPSGVREWNWGAFWLGPLWALGHPVWHSFFASFLLQFLTSIRAYWNFYDKLCAFCSGGLTGELAAMVFYDDLMAGR